MMICRTKKAFSNNAKPLLYHKGIAVCHICQNCLYGTLASLAVAAPDSKIDLTLPMSSCKACSLFGLVLGWGLGGAFMTALSPSDQPHRFPVIYFWMLP